MALRKPQSTHFSQAVKLPAIARGFERIGAIFLIPYGYEFCSEFFAESQLLFVKLGRLEETTDLLTPLHIGRLGIPFLLLLLDSKELGVVPSELLEGDQEVSEVQAELVVLGVQGENSLHEAVYLRPGLLSALHLKCPTMV